MHLRVALTAKHTLQSWPFSIRGIPFSEITTHRLTYPECCGLAKPGVAEDLLLVSDPVDDLDNHTTEMWDILTRIVLREWFGLRLPPSNLPWSGPIVLPFGMRLNDCFDRTTARQVRSRIRSCDGSIYSEVGRLSNFAGHGLSIPEDRQREREGFEFLSRQADHFRSVNDSLFVTQGLTDREC